MKINLILACLVLESRTKIQGILKRNGQINAQIFSRHGQA